MELELGLALSSTNFGKDPILKELDLISHVSCDVKPLFDDNSSLSSQSSVNYHDDDDEEEEFDAILFVNGMKKRGHEVEMESSVFSPSPKTLPLLLWDKEPNEHQKEPKRLCKSNSFTINKNDGDGLVGWPPIKSYRKKQNQLNDHIHGQHHHQLHGGACGGGGVRSMYIKVQMEGFLITRKIDLKQYQSYQSLILTLLNMFGKGQESVEYYKLTYQDREGDWLLVGDVPWRTFIRSVQRLKLLRRDG